MKHVAVIFCAALALACASQADEVAAQTLNAQQEARARALEKELRCVVCQGQSLDESNAPLAADLRHLIRERIVAGESDAAVKQYLVARYGDFILLKPPLAPNTYLLWFGPAFALLLGAIAILVVTGRARQRATQATGTSDLS